MKKVYNKFILILILTVLISCAKKEKGKESVVASHVKNDIMGTWQLVYGEIKTADSLEIKNLSNTEFIKILNKDHFAFFNQVKGSTEGFYGGGGTYTLEGNAYVEQLDYIGVNELRGHKFPFTIEIKGDTLIQSGIEDVPEAGIKRHIVEKYIRIK